MSPSSISLRPIYKVVFAAVLGVLLIVGVVAMPDARADDGDRVAVLSPIVDSIAVGNDLGPALLCPTALSALQQALPLLPVEVAEAVSMVTDNVNTACGDLSDANAPLIQEFSDALSALSPANPAVRPMLEVLRVMLETGGASSGDLLGAKTLTQLAEIVAWAEG